MPYLSKRDLSDTRGLFFTRIMTIPRSEGPSTYSLRGPRGCTFSFAVVIKLTACVRKKEIKNPMQGPLFLSRPSLLSFQGEILEGPSCLK